MDAMFVGSLDGNAPPLSQRRRLRHTRTVRPVN